MLVYFSSKLQILGSSRILSIDLDGHTKLIFFCLTALSVYHRLGHLRVRNVHVFNFCCVAKWQKLNVHIRIFCAFIFRRLSNWRKIFNGKNFQIYGMLEIKNNGSWPEGLVCF